jgi:hypothetical protein
VRRARGAGAAPMAPVVPIKTPFRVQVREAAVRWCEQGSHYAQFPRRNGDAPPHKTTHMTSTSSRSEFCTYARNVGLRRVLT